MSHNSRLSPANPTNKDIYWFAHGGDISSSVQHNNTEESSESKEVTSPVSQKEREDRIRQFREHQEEERRRRLGELQHATIQAQKYREQLEEERRRKIEELRVKELERRQAVEERKRMIWEAEQERKEAILKRNLEREARIEARRNAQRNSMSFAFGSSTPRTFDLDLVALGSGRLSSQSTVVFSSASNRHLDDKDLESKKYVGANGLDRKPEDNANIAEGIIGETMNIQTRETNLESSLQVTNDSKNGLFISLISDDDRGSLTISEHKDPSLGPKKQLQYHPYSSGCLIGSGAMVGE